MDTGVSRIKTGIQYHHFLEKVSRFIGHSPTASSWMLPHIKPEKIQ
jgi:hypothetical protein